jgi:hypothetical protein
MALHADPDRFLDVLKPDRCPLCFLLHDYVHEHLKSVLDESVTDPITREALFQSRGFCRRHAWQAVQQGKNLGVAVIYGSLLEKGLKELSSGPKFWNQSEKLRDAFSTSGILCLSHLEKVLLQRLNPSHRKNLYETAKKALEGLLKDLNEFLEKQDYHRSHESFGKERDAWIQAVRMISGERE